MKLTFAILKKQGKEVDTAWFDDYCESFASIQKENFVREEAFLEKFRKNLLSMEHMYAAGCGPAEGVAKEAALKIGETVKIVSCGYELEEIYSLGQIYNYLQSTTYLLLMHRMKLRIVLIRFLELQELFQTACITSQIKNTRMIMY